MLYWLSFPDVCCANMANFSISPITGWRPRFEPNSSVVTAMHCSLVRLIQRTVRVSTNGGSLKAKSAVPAFKSRSIVRTFVRAVPPFFWSLVSVFLFLCDSTLSFLTLAFCFRFVLGTQVENARV